MRTIPLKQIYERVIRLHGRNPKSGVNSDVADAIVDHINDRVSTICSTWLWPEWVITEERAFRPVWNSTEQYLKVNPTDSLPEEVFYLGAAYVVGGDFGTGYGYYRVKSDAPANPPIGTVPTSTVYWEAITPLDTFIEYNQRDRRSIGMVLNVYSQNPRVPTGSMNGTKRFTPSEKGIDVPGGGTSVFITHKMPCPSYTLTPYVTGKTYVRGDVVFDTPTGECFQAVDTTSFAPSNNAHWNWIPFLEVWADYVCKGAFADSLMEFDQGGNGELQAKMVLAQYWNQSADDAYQQEVDALAVQGQRLKWSFCDRRYWSEAEVCACGIVTLTDS